MTKELVTEQIRVHQLSPEDAKSLLMSTHATLLSMNQEEAPGAVTANSEAPKDIVHSDWKRSIAKHTITCLECGSSFRQLSARHLRLHDLDPNTYRTKYGIPSTQALSSREATARRRELAQQIQPWEVAASKCTGCQRRHEGEDERQTPVDTCGRGEMCPYICEI